MIDELALVGVVLAAVAMISCLSVARRRTIRRLPRGAWVAVILLVPVIGPIAWFAAGRPLRLGGPRPPAAANQAPDDDPDFLRSLDLPGAGTTRPGTQPGSPEPGTGDAGPGGAGPGASGPGPGADSGGPDSGGEQPGR